MWFFGSDFFVSVVADRNDHDQLLVRARRPGDVERFLAPAVNDGLCSDVEVFTDDAADYLYRAFVKRDAVSCAVAHHVIDINYDNFKNSIMNGRYKHACSLVWSDMYQLQREQAPSWFLDPVDEPFPES